jgi:hypothetical protein
MKRLEHGKAADYATEPHRTNKVVNEALPRMSLEEELFL